MGFYVAAENCRTSTDIFFQDKTGSHPNIFSKNRGVSLFFPKATLFSWASPYSARVFFEGLAGGKVLVLREFATTTFKTIWLIDVDKTVVQHTFFCFHQDRHPLLRQKRARKIGLCRRNFPLSSVSADIPKKSSHIILGVSRFLPCIPHLCRRPVHFVQRA